MPPPPPRDETTHTETDRDFAHYRRTRDPEALGRVFDATAGKLLVAMHLVRDASAAEDVVQATFLAAMRSAEQYDPAQPLLPWLLGILTNQAALAWRERRRQPDPERIAQPAASDPARIAETRELADEVARAIDAIAAPYRQVLVLAFVHGLRGVEIARALDRSPETVRSQLHRGLQMLRKALPRSLAVPAFAFASGTGRGLTAVRAAVHAQAHALHGALVGSVGAGLFLGSVLVHKLVLTAVGAAAAALLLWTLWPAPAALRSSGAVNATGIDAARVDAGGKQGADAGAPTGPQREVASPTAIAGPTLRVLVVDAQTGAAEPSAEVLSVGDLDADRLPAAAAKEFAVLENDPEQQARRFGELWRTGGDGAVLLPRPRRWGPKFVARAGGRYGQAMFVREGPELRIELEDDLTLRARAVGPDDAPLADVELVIVGRWRGTEEPELRTLGKTDADGMLTVPHLQGTIAEVTRLHQERATSWALTAHIPGLSMAGTPLDLAQLQRDPIVVRVPATGAIAVGLVDAAGHPDRELSGAVLLEQPADGAGLTFSERMGNSFWRSADGNESRIVFPHVGLGTSFQVTPNAPAIGQLGYRTGPGPQRAGEEVVFRFTAPDPPLLVRGRAVDACAVPLANWGFNLTVECGDAPVQAISHTDGDGCFRCRVGVDQRCAAERVRSVRLAPWGHGRHDGAQARVEPAGALAHGELDLGDVTFTDQPLLAAGTLTDDEGGFVSSAQFEVRPLGAPANGATSAAPLPIGLGLGPDDRFAIRGDVTEPRLVLTLKDDTYYVPIAPLPFDRGATDLHLVLRRKGEIKATVLHDLPFWASLLLSIEAVGEGGAAPQGRWGGTGHLAPGRLRVGLSGLPAGRYALRLRLVGESEPLAVIPDVVVGAGPARDPRLDAIDLRGRLRVAHLRVVDAGGAPVRGYGSLLLKDSGADTTGIRWIQLADGEFAVPIATHAVDGTIRVPGYRTQELRGIDGDRTVTLQAEIDVEARLVPALALPDGVTLRAFTKSTTADSSFADLLARTVRKEHGPIHGSGTEANTMPGPGRFAFRFADGGDYAFTFVLARTDGQWSVALPATPAVVAVRAAAGVQTFTFTTDDARLQQALLDLRGH